MDAVPPEYLLVRGGSGVRLFVCKTDRGSRARVQACVGQRRLIPNWIVTQRVKVDNGNAVSLNTHTMA
jgi:hypothetical protein